MRNLNKKQKSWILFLISLFLVFTVGTLVTIGCFSSYLIKKTIWYIFISFLIILVILLIFSIYKLIKYKRRRLFSKKVVIPLNILVTLYIIGCSAFLFILYGPISTFRNWLITTAMATMNHQYYCKWFYNNDMIDSVLNSNYVIEVEDDTDASLVDKNKVTINAKDEYDREILDHDEDDLYKIIRFKVNGQEAYLAAIYDASKISVGVTKWLHRSGQYATDMAKEHNAPLAINGGGFNDPNHNSKGGSPVGITIADGKIITSDNVSGSYGIIGFNQDDVLVLRRQVNANTLIKEGVRDAVTMGPFLIVNGKRSQFYGNGGWGIAARTAIGQREDGIVLFLVIDSNPSRTKGASIVDLADIMQRYGAINAANLDGGTSSVMVVDGELINDPIDSTGAHKTRGIPTVFMVKD